MTNGKSCRDAGFTLLEMLVVLVIMGIVVSAAVLNYRSKPNLQIVSAQLTSELNFARSTAISRNRPVTLLIDPNGKGMRSTSTRSGMAVPNGVRLTFSPVDGIGRAAHKSKLVFFADGSSTGGAFKLLDSSRSVVVRVDWLSGAVTQEGAADARPRG